MSYHLKLAAHRPIVCAARHLDRRSPIAYDRKLTTGLRLTAAHRPPHTATIVHNWIYKPGGILIKHWPPPFCLYPNFNNMAPSVEESVQAIANVLGMCVINRLLKRRRNRNKKRRVCHSHLVQAWTVSRIVF